MTQTVTIDTRLLPDGRTEVFDPVRRRWVALTPEEQVRQHTLLFLHHTLAYPYELMQVEGSITLNGMARRCDIVIYDRTGQPQIIVECKRPDVPLTQHVCDQACRYNTILHVPFLLLTNGRQQVSISVDFQQGKLKQLPQLPPYQPQT